eukprot:11150518-Karenia_brevis.AAC.1
MDEKIVQALSARSASLGCAQKLDNHEWPLSLLWKMPDLENQLDVRSLLIMCSTLGGHFQQFFLSNWKHIGGGIYGLEYVNLKVARQLLGKSRKRKKCLYNVFGMSLTF